MIISHIETPLYNYFNFHAEEVISSNYLNDDNQGIYISSLQFETVNRLFNYIKEYLNLYSNSLEYIKCPYCTNGFRKEVDFYFYKKNRIYDYFEN